MLKRLQFCTSATLFFFYNTLDLFFICISIPTMLFRLTAVRLSPGKNLKDAHVLSYSLYALKPS